MKSKRVEFHKLRYPAHLAKIPQLSRAHVEKLYAEVDRRRNRYDYEAFLRWCAGNKTALESPIFKSYYAVRQTEERKKQLLFFRLSAISEHYSVSLGLLGGWSSFLNRSHEDCDKTIQMTRMLLVEIAIFESTFSAAYSAHLASTEYRNWLEENPRMEPPHAKFDKAFHLYSKWAKKQAPEKYVVDAKLCVERGDLSSEQLNLKREEKKRLSQVNHDLEFDDDRSSIIEDYIAQDMQLNEQCPLSLAGIKDMLEKWDNNGRHLGWHPLAMRRRQEFDRLDRIVDQAVAANSVEDRDFAEILWTGGEGYRRMREW